MLKDPRSGQRIELNWYPAGTRYGRRHLPGEGLDHLGFLLGKVPRRALEKEYRRLLRAGARPTEITPERSEGWVFDVMGPDGIWIEFFRHPTSADIRAARRQAQPRPSTGRRRRRAP